MNKFWSLIQQVEVAADPVETGPDVFSLNLGTSFWTLIIFGVLVVVLSRWAFPPILGYAQAREERIQRSMDEARQAREAAQRALEEQRRELDRAREESQQIVARGKQDAEKLRLDLLERAKAEQQEMLERARREIEREKDLALESIRQETVELAIAAGSHLVGRRLDAEEDRRLVSEFLDRADPDRAGAGVA